MLQAPEIRENGNSNSTESPSEPRSTRQRRLVDPDSLMFVVTLRRSIFESLPLLERRQRRLHQLGLAAMTLQRADQAVDLSVRLVQRGLCRLGLLQNGLEAVAALVVAVLFLRR